MKRYSFLIASLLGLVLLLASCEKEGEKVIILDTVNPPALGDLPNLVLQRTDANKTITFIGTPVNPGFQASAEYFLEVDVAGNNFANPLVLYSGSKGDTIRILASTLNGRLLEKFIAEVNTNANFRLRSVLNVDAGQGAPGSGANPMVFTSATKTVVVNPFGLPRLNLVGSGMAQMIQSAAGDGVFKGFVKTNPANPFTLTDPDTGTSYGGAGGTLQQGGSAITPPAAAGWHILTVNLNANSYSFEPYFMGVVGSATPNGWDAPDQKMDYVFATKTWTKTLNLVVGHFKFRRNDGWAFNFGFVNAPTGPLPWVSIPLQRGGVGNDFEIAAAGNYTITLTIAADEQSAVTTIVKN
jgi:hypothetical protein